jgi:hypothetical protein
VVIRWGIVFFILCSSAPLEPHFIRHRDSVARFNSRFFGTARLEPHFIRYRDSAPLFNSRFFGAAPLEPHFIRHRDSVALFNSRFFSTAPLEPHLIHYSEPVPKKKYPTSPGCGIEHREPVVKIKISFQP